MNNLKTYFASPEKRRSNGTSQGDATLAVAQSNSEIAEAAAAENKATDPTKENGTTLEVEEISSPLYVIKKPSADSKLILQNMEEVLNSVKKKHRQKHRRKREQKKLAQLEAEAVAVAVAVKAKANQKIAAAMQQAMGADSKAPSKKPLREKTEQFVNGGMQATNVSKQTPTKRSQLKSASPNETILQHFARTPKKSEIASAIDEKGKPSLATAKETTESVKIATKTNAFEVLMNARNKSIGSNTPGKELAVPDEEATTSTSTAANVKRKLLLQEWSERKGGAKRKIEEEDRAAFVNKQLENRAKRFKKMLVTGSIPQNAEIVKEQPKENAKHKKLKKKVAATVGVKEKEGENESGNPKRKRGRPPKQRLLSVDSSEEPLPPANKAQDADTVEFLAKLSSPTKKRDSLLGYFPKKDLPKLAADKEVASSQQNPVSSSTKEADSTPKRTRRSLAEKFTAAEPTSSPSIEVQTDKTEEATDVSDTPSRRPRRSCVGKARYDYDLQESPTKHKTTKSFKSTTAAPSDDEETIIIDLGDSSSSKTPEQTPTKKLAPLFVRSVPKPSPDPALLKARQAFLMSGVPEKMRIEMAKQKQYEQSYEEALELFPKLAHIHQFSPAEQKLVTESIAISFRFVKDEPTAAAVRKSRRSKAEKTRSASDITKSKAPAAFSFPTIKPPPLASLPNKRNIIKDWKTKYERFPTYKCYNQMREKYRFFSAIDSEQDTEQVTESFVVTRRSTRRKIESLEQAELDPNAEDAKPPATAPNGELLFTDKYKPLLFEQFLVNLSPVSELREFLSNWSVGTSARNSQGLDDSSDFDNDSNSNSSQQVSSNTVVLVGPGSSGKTSSVFAVANELNLNVLEINAGMKRTGKKLLQELHEATQSHQIRKDARAQGKAKNNLLKMSLNGLKTKTKSNSQNLEGCDSSPGSGDSSSTSARKCLILIEDADIVFDQMDAGFTDAIYTLAANSKRPVIIVASDMQCLHLQRLMQQNAIYFNEPSTMNISRYMAVLALMENCPVELDHLVSLYIYNKKNLRKTLLELQFFIQSGGDRIGDRNVSTQSKEKQQQSDQAAFFASPTKRKLAEEASSMLGTATDDVLNKEKSGLHSPTQPKLYTHQSLFKFYTTAQNEKWRIPYPVDFSLLRDNLDEILRSSPKLSPKSWAGTNDSSASTTVAAVTTKRKSRSPKKVWLTAAAAQQTMPLKDLSDFYENLSIACLLGARGGDALIMDRKPHFADRLVPHLAEDIAHELVEKAIDCNVQAQPFAYNLNHAPIEKQPLVDCLGSSALRTQRTRALDFEPTLRSICRSEKLRATFERRSTRFYHYLRNGAGSLTAQFDDACAILSNEPASRDASAHVDGAVADSTIST